jgi:hypothetical protein
MGFSLLKSRSSRLQEWASARGWLFHEGDVSHPWRHHLGRKWPNLTVHRMLTGTVYGAATGAADCSYPLHGSDPDTNTTTQKTQRMAIFLSPAPPGLPQLAVSRPEWRGNPMRRRRLPMALPSAIKFGYGDFDGYHTVESPDPAAVRGAFTQALLDAHVQGLFEELLAGAELIEWDVAGSDLICVYDRSLKAEMIQPGVERLLRLAALLSPAR